MAKNQNTFEKRRREVDKKHKADEKRKRRKEKKLRGDQPATTVADREEDAQKTTSD